MSESTEATINPPPSSPDSSPSMERQDQIIDDWNEQLSEGDKAQSEAMAEKPEAEAPQEKPEPEPDSKPEDDPEEEKPKFLDPRFAHLARKGAEARKEQDAAKTEREAAEQAKSEAQKLLDEARAEREAARKEAEEARGIGHRWATDPLAALKASGQDPASFYERLQQQVKDPQGFQAMQAQNSQVEALQAALQPLQDEIAALKAHREEQSKAQEQAERERTVAKNRNDFLEMVGTDGSEKWPVLKAYHDTLGRDSVLAYAAQISDAMAEAGEPFSLTEIAARVDAYLTRIRELDVSAPTGEKPTEPTPKTPRPSRGTTTLTNSHGVQTVGADPQSEEAREARWDKLAEGFFETLGD